MRRRAVWGEAVMVGGLGRRCVCLADVKWLRMFGRQAQCSAVRGTWYALNACVARG